jgi:hypothetical protein
MGERERKLDVELAVELVVELAVTITKKPASGESRAEPKVLVVFNSSVPVSTPLSRYSSAHKSVILVANVS